MFKVIVYNIFMNNKTNIALKIKFNNVIFNSYIILMLIFEAHYSITFRIWSVGPTK